MDGDLKNLMSTDNRRLIMKSANITKANLTRSAKKFLSIGILEQSNDGRYLIPELMKPIIGKDNKINLNFVLDLNKPKVDDKL
jgi:hypothetical protein